MFLFLNWVKIAQRLSLVDACQTNKQTNPATVVAHHHHPCFIPRTETIPGTPSYKAVMRLHITEVQHSDYGVYRCIAKNPRGETDGTIRLYCEYCLSLCG